MAVGCQQHEVRIIDRDGATVCAGQPVQVRWQRLLSEVSVAQVVIEVGGDCCGCLQDVRAWRHRLAIWRAGKLVWDGPVMLPVWPSDAGLNITALDVLAWLDVRVPHRDVDFRDQPLTRIAEWLVRDGFAPDDPGHEVQIVASGSSFGDREYREAEGQTGDHLRDLAGTGIGYTALGSRILIFPEGFCDRAGSLTDADFPDGLRVAEDGASLTTRAIVHGDPQREVVGIAGGVDPYYGLVERVFEEPSIPSSRSAQAAARAYVAAGRPLPVWVLSEEATLAPDANIDMAQLVPGYCLDVATTATCRTITQQLRIASVSVSEDADGETIGLTLSPPGAPL